MPAQASADGQSTPGEVAEELHQLVTELGIVNDTLIGIREDIAWGIHNGRVILSLADVSQFAHEPDLTIDGSLVELTIRLCTKLRAVREDVNRIVEQRHSPLPPNRTPAVLYEVGQAVEFDGDEGEQFGEILEVDEAANAAVVLLIPSQERVQVSQDLLRLVELESEEPPSFATRDDSVPHQQEQPTASNADAAHRRPGHLF